MKQIRSDAGFSLIETIVALGVLATAAVSLSTLGRGSISGVKQLEARYLARMVAQEQLVEQFTARLPLRTETVEGETEQFGQTFAWTKTIAPAGQPGLFLIRIEVISEDGLTLARISTLQGDG